MLPYFIYGFFAVQAFYLLGSVYFSRYSFIITTIVGSALIFVFVYYSAELTESIMNGYSFNGDHLRKYDEGYSSYKRYELSTWTTDILVLCCKIYLGAGFLGSGLVQVKGERDLMCKYANQRLWRDKLCKCEIDEYDSRLKKMKYAI